MTGNPAAIQDSDHEEPVNKKGAEFSFVRVLTVLAIIIVTAFFMLVPSRGSSVREAARRTQCKNNLKQIGLALFKYALDFNALPPAFTVDENGKPLHSWRTLILPYVDQKVLYQKIDFSKPWDHPANAEACKSRPSFYCCPSISCPANYTTYMAIVAPDSCLLLNEPRDLSEMTDNHRKTLMIIEVAAEHAVHWMSPADADENLAISFVQGNKPPHVGGSYGAGGVHTALADGSVRFIRADTPAAELRAAMTFDGRDKSGLNH